MKNLKKIVNRITPCIWGVGIMFTIIYIIASSIDPLNFDFTQWSEKKIYGFLLSNVILNGLVILLCCLDD